MAAGTRDHGHGLISLVYSVIAVVLHEMQCEIQNELANCMRSRSMSLVM